MKKVGSHNPEIWKGFRHKAAILYLRYNSLKVAIVSYCGYYNIAIIAIIAVPLLICLRYKIAPLSFQNMNDVVTEQSWILLEFQSLEVCL